MIKTIIVCILASLGAGLTTGFAGLSASVFITPMLTAVLDYSFYDAVGIALASDILASATSAITYAKNGSLDLKHGKHLMLSVWTAAIIGSIAAYFLSSFRWGNTALSYWSIIGSFFIGVSLYARANKPQKTIDRDYSGKRNAIIVLCGAYIGFVCGFQGSGGGLMLLLALTLVMSYEFKTAVGTSVFIMTFTALIGASSHFFINGLPDWRALLLCVAATTVFAMMGAHIATKLPAAKLKKVTGFILVISSIVLIALRISNMI